MQVEGTMCGIYHGGDSIDDISLQDWGFHMESPLNLFKWGKKYKILLIW